MALQFDVVSNVTVPILKVDTTRPVYVQFEGGIYLAPENAKVRARAVSEGKEPQAPPHLARVINLETGEEMQIVCNEVLVSELREKYPNDSYVGKQFALSKFAPGGGKRYNTFDIKEIKVKKPNTATSAAPQAEEVVAAADTNGVPAMDAELGQGEAEMPAETVEAGGAGGSGKHRAGRHKG